MTTLKFAQHCRKTPKNASFSAAPSSMRMIFARGMEAHIKTLNGEAHARAAAAFYPAKRRLCSPPPAIGPEFIDLRNVISIRSRARSS